MIDLDALCWRERLRSTTDIRSTSTRGRQKCTAICTSTRKRVCKQEAEVTALARMPAPRCRPGTGGPRRGATNGATCTMPTAAACRSSVVALSALASGSVASSVVIDVDVISHTVPVASCAHCSWGYPGLARARAHPKACVQRNDTCTHALGD